VRTFKAFAIWILLAQSAQTVFIYFFIPISESAVYGTHDDALIASISNGQLTGQPTGYLVFLNLLIGLPISWLQQIIPNANVYIYLLTFVVTLCFSVIFGFINSEKRILMKIR
jgi:hypothetical protein